MIPDKAAAYSTPLLRPQDTRFSISSCLLHPISISSERRNFHESSNSIYRRTLCRILYCHSLQAAYSSLALSLFEMAQSRHLCVDKRQSRVPPTVDRTITLFEPPLYPNLLYQEPADPTSPTDFAEFYSSPYSIPHRNGPIIPSKSVNDSTRN
jgi:hypothetical protein